MTFRQARQVAVISMLVPLTACALQTERMESNATNAEPLKIHVVLKPVPVTSIFDEQKNDSEKTILIGERLRNRF